MTKNTIAMAMDGSVSNDDKYTLDRIENDMYVLLEYPDEEEQLLISVNKYTGKLAQGDIVRIGNGMLVKVLEQETQEMKGKVNNLLEKLKNKE